MHKLDDDPQNKLLFSGVEYCFEFDILKIVFNFYLEELYVSFYKNIHKLISEMPHYSSCCKILPSNANSCNFSATYLFLRLKYKMS